MNNTIRVKCFSSGYDSDLEEKVNKWISENEVEIVDIKFSSSMCGDEVKIYYDSCVLIIYKTV